MAAELVKVCDGDVQALLGKYSQRECESLEEELRSIPVEDWTDFGRELVHMATVNREMLVSKLTAMDKAIGLG